MPRCPGHVVLVHSDAIAILRTRIATLSHVAEGLPQFLRLLINVLQFLLSEGFHLLGELTFCFLVDLSLVATNAVMDQKFACVSQIGVWLLEVFSELTNKVFLPLAHVGTL